MLNLIIAVVVGFVLGFVTGALVYRNNPKTVAKGESIAQQAETKTDQVISDIKK